MVILCHGHAGSLDSDLRYAPAFHQHGFDVLQFDFRAHGRSQGQEVSMGYYERLDLLAAVAWAQERGFERVGILGFSMGGAVAISTAAQCLGIAAVASDSGFARLQPTLQAGLQQRGLPNWLAKLVTPWMMRMAGWRLHCRLDEADPLRWVHKISPRPVLFIHGGRDRYVDRTEIEALHASAGNPKALWFVQEAEHRRIDRVRPEEYQARVLGFFERWLAEGGQDESVATR
jgi:pimeloyl-ACP methyl ester carboxylesterase